MKKEKKLHDIMEEKKTLHEEVDKKSNLKIGYWLVSTGTKALSDSVLSPFIPLYGRSLGATSTEIGFIVSITSLLNITQILWAFLAEKYKISRFLAIVASYLSSIFSFILLPVKNIFLFASMRGLNSVVFSATLPTSSNIFAERTSPRSWSMRTSLIQGVLVFGTLIGTLIGGVILWKIPSNYSYPTIFIGGGIISIFSAVFFHLAVPSKKKLETKGRWVQIEEVGLTLSNTLATMKTDVNFVIFCFVNLLFVFGVNLTGPFFIIFNTTHYDLTIFDTALLTSIGLIPQTLSSLITARLIEKARKKELIVLAGILTSFFPVFFMIPSLTGRVTNVFWILIIIWSINGIAWGIINSSLTTLLLDIIHPRRRTLQLAIFNSISSIALFVAPIIGGLIIEKTITIYTILIVSAALRFIGALLFGIIKEPVIGGTILRPIQRVFPSLVRTNAERGITIFTSSKSTKRIKNRNKKIE